MKHRVKLTLLHSLSCPGRLSERRLPEVARSCAPLTAKLFDGDERKLSASEEIPKAKKREAQPIGFFTGSRRLCRLAWS
jgi:hypothetical protein